MQRRDEIESDIEIDIVEAAPANLPAPRQEERPVPFYTVLYQGHLHAEDLNSLRSSLSIPNFLNTLALISAFSFFDGRVNDNANEQILAASASLITYIVTFFHGLRETLRAHAPDSLQTIENDLPVFTTNHPEYRAEIGNVAQFRLFANRQIAMHDRAELKKLNYLSSFILQTALLALTGIFASINTSSKSRGERDTGIFSISLAFLILSAIAGVAAPFIKKQSRQNHDGPNPPQRFELRTRALN